MNQPKPFGILARSALPSTAVFEMTYRCNHQCLYCSCPWEAPRSNYPVKKEMDADEWCSLISYLTSEHGVCRIAFTGGEPTLKPELARIMRFAAGQTSEYIIDDETKGLHKELKPPEIYVISNGRNLDSEWLKLFKELKINVSISVPGLTTYSDHTKHGTAWEALAWIKRISDEGLHVTANITVTKLNFHELYETIGQAFLHGAKFLLMNRFLPGGRGIRHSESLFLSGKEVREAILVAEDVLEAANRPGSLGTEVPKCLVSDIKTKRLSVGTRCSAGRDFFAIDPSGNVRPCNHSPVVLGRWTEISAILRSDYWKRFVFKDFLPSTCKACSLSSQCDAGCREAAHIVGGSLDSPDPVLPGGQDWRK